MKFLALILFMFACVVSRAQNTLAGTLTVQKWMKLQGDLPVSVTGSQNNFNPTGLDVSGILYLTADADLNITGIVPTTAPTGNDGRILAVFNVDSADTITLVNQSASSTAANRMSLGTDMALTPNGPGVWLIYDTNISRWRVFGGSGGSSGGGGGGVTSVGLDLPSSVFDITGSPVTTTGTLAGSFKTQTANRVFAGPASGSAATPTFRALVALDIPDISSTYLTVTTAASTYLTQTNAASTYLTQANAATTYQPLNAKLTSFAALANAAGWLHNNGSGTFAYSTPTKSDVGLGSVENTALSTWGGSTSITTLGTISAGTWQGTAIADTYISSAATWNAKGTGSVTSVSMTVPSFLSIAGSPVTTSGTLAVTLATQSANLVFAGPSSGSAAAPTFRSLVVLDVPTLNQNTTGSAAKWTTSRNLAGNSVDGSADVAFANKFIVQGTTDAGLSAAQFLGALGTGIVKNTTTTGVLSIAIAADFPTLNQSTTGSAATLTTARLINSVSFNGSADITVTAAAGTLTGTTLNSTVVTSSLTAVGTVTSGTWSAVTIGVNRGGTGFATYAVGDILYADATQSLSKLAGVATGNALISGGVTTAPSWGKVGLTTHVSGTLGAGNGGTGFASYTVGDLLYADTTSSLNKLAAVAAGQVLVSQGLSTNPAWTPTPTLQTLTLSKTTRPELFWTYGSTTGKGHIQASVANALYITQNLSFDGTNWQRDDTSFNGTAYGSTTSTSAFSFVWLSAATASNPATLTTRMTLDVSGLAVVGGITSTTAVTFGDGAGTYYKVTSNGGSGGAFQMRKNGTDYGILYGNETNTILDSNTSANLLLQVAGTTRGLFTVSGLDVTGALTATTTITSAGRIQANYANPLIQWFDTGGTTNNKRYDFQATGQTFVARLINDADSSAGNWLLVSRSLNVASSIVLTGTAITLSGNTSVSGTLGTTGTITYTAGSVTTILTGQASTSGIVGTTSNHPLQLYTNNAVAATLSTGGTLTLVGGLSTGGSIGSNTSNLYSGNNSFSFGSSTIGWYTQTTGQSVQACSADVVQYVKRRVSDGGIVVFYRDETQVGQISVTTTATSYVTSSDIRLKTNIRNVSGSGAIIDALRPVLFDWRSKYNSNTYGFIAQEVYKVFPQAVIKGDDGETIKQQWGMDSSKLMPVVVSELQSLRARVKVLEDSPGRVKL